MPPSVSEVMFTANVYYDGDDDVVDGGGGGICSLFFSLRAIIETRRDFGATRRKKTGRTV